MSDRLVFRIAFSLPGGDHGRYWYHRDRDEISDGVRVTTPTTTTNFREAHRFHNSDSAIAFRDKFRVSYPECKVWIEDTQGNGPLFDRPTEVPRPTEDDRQACFVSPDGFEGTGLGFLVKPALRPSGRCWCVKPIDVPSMKDRVTSTETVYGNTPFETVAAVLTTWGSLAVPHRPPWADEQDRKQAERLASEQEFAKNGNRRLRPGDIRR